MKKLKKNIDGFLICEECGRLCKKNVKSLVQHFFKTHKMKSKEYYDKWIKEKNEGYCHECGNESLFATISVGYKKFCCVKCVQNSNEVKQKGRQTRKEKYGDENYNNKYKTINTKKNKSEKEKQNTKNKRKKTNLQRYGVEYNWQFDTIKNRTRTEEEIISSNKKRKETNKKIYGVEWHTQSENFKIKTKKTWLENYGVDHPMQNAEICQKSVRARLYVYHYLETDLTYQASYEEDFLDTYYGKIDIENGKSFKYILDNKSHVYHSDFFIPSLNLIVEIKNSHLVERDKEEIEAKKQSVLNVGFNYIMIVDKDYTKFKQIIKPINEVS